jgi:hypothetical protein
MPTEHPIDHAMRAVKTQILDAEFMLAGLRGTLTEMKASRPLMRRPIEEADKERRWLLGWEANGRPFVMTWDNIVGRWIMSGHGRAVEPVSCATID